MRKTVKDLSKYIQGVHQVGLVVGSTMGAKGKNVVVGKGYGAGDVSNDGAFIAQNEDNEDEQIKMGIEGIRDIAAEVAKEVGDATSATITIGDAILQEGIKYPLTNEIRESLHKTKEYVVKRLGEVSKPVKNRKDSLDVAITSVESQELGEIIVDLYEQVGDNGVITVETKVGGGIEVEVTEGYEIKKGMVHPDMANSGKESVLTGVKCLVVTGSLMLATELIPFLDKMVKANNKELLIFCEDIDPSLINFFRVNKAQGTFNGVVVRVQSQNNEILEDIALVTGATLVKRDTGVPLETLDIKVLGFAQKIVSDSEKTIIFKGKGSVKPKIAELKIRLSTEKNPNIYDLIENRIARLGNSVGVIRVGAEDEGETNYLKDKVVDAVAAVRSAKEEGVVEGGGMCLYRISQELDDSTIGNKIMKKALTAPLRWILSNADKDYTEVLLNLPKGQGYDVKNMKYAPMLKVGITDTRKGLRCAVEKTVSFAGAILTAGHVNYIQNEKDK